MSDVADRVKKIVVEHLGIEEEKVTEGQWTIEVVEVKRRRIITLRVTSS